MKKENTIKYILALCIALLLVTTSAIAATCGVWSSQTSYVGKFDTGFRNTLTINNITVKNNICYIDLLYTVDPKGTFKGRTDVINGTTLTQKGEIRFKTLGKDGGTITYTRKKPTKVKGVYRSGSQIMYVTLKKVK